jgi:hypothetical protein
MSDMWEKDKKYIKKRSFVNVLVKVVPHMSDMWEICGEIFVPILQTNPMGLVCKWPLFV